jgi:hypothetical protein
MNNDAEKKPAEKDGYFFLFNGTKYETEHSALTGAQIKALIPNFDQTHTLVLEGHGSDADTTIGDNETVSLAKDKGPRHFYSVPPATFG